MEKVSTVARWPGKVETPAYMNFPTLRRWENAMNEAKKVVEVQKSSGDPVISDFYLKLLPVATSIVTEWHIDGLPDKVDENNFPASSDLAGWLIECMSDLQVRTNSVDPKSSEQP